MADPLQTTRFELTGDAVMHQYWRVDYDELKDLLLSETGARSVRALALAIGMEPSTLGRQLRADLPIATLVAICRKYRIQIVPMMVEVGYITPEEAKSGSIPAVLREASDALLMSETLRRVQVGQATPAITEPLIVGGSDEDYDVTPTHIDEVGLAAKRGKRKVDQTSAD